MFSVRFVCVVFGFLVSLSVSRDREKLLAQFSWNWIELSFLWKDVAWAKEQTKITFWSRSESQGRYTNYFFTFVIGRLFCGAGIIGKICSQHCEIERALAEVCSYLQLLNKIKYINYSCFITCSLVNPARQTWPIISKKIVCSCNKFKETNQFTYHI